MEADCTEDEESNDVAALEERREREENNGIFSRGRSLISRHRGKAAIAAAGLIAMGFAWKFGYLDDALDMAKSALKKAEACGRPKISPHSAGSMSSPNTSNPQPRAYTTPQAPFAVNWHVRNLHPGWTNSLENRELAAKYGVSLLPNQSFIPTYEKYRDAA